MINVEEHTRHIIRTKAAPAAAGGPNARGAARTHRQVGKPGDRVEKGATLLVIEAMKMENEFRAGASGTVAEVRVEPGQP